MSDLRRRPRGKVTALVATALCSVVSLFTTFTTAAGASPLSSGGGSPGEPLTLSAGSTELPTGLAVADLSNGANGTVTLTIGPCVLDAQTSCSGVLSEISLIGNFKDDAGNPLYSDSSPASVSWTCNALLCPPTRNFVPGSSTTTELQIAEFNAHTMYVALRNPNGSFQPFAPAPACNGLDQTPLPTGTIDPQDTGGVEFCVDVGAISRADADCQAVCSAWSGPLTLPVLFVEDPKFLGT